MPDRLLAIKGFLTNILGLLSCSSFWELAINHPLFTITLQKIQLSRIVAENARRINLHLFPVLSFWIHYYYLQSKKAEDLLTPNVSIYCCFALVRQNCSAVWYGKCNDNKRTQDVALMLVLRCSTVYGVEPTSYQHWFNVLFLWEVHRISIWW